MAEELVQCSETAKPELRWDCGTVRLKAGSRKEPDWASQGPHHPSALSGWTAGRALVGLCPTPVSAMRSAAAAGPQPARLSHSSKRDWTASAPGLGLQQFPQKTGGGGKIGGLLCECETAGLADKSHLSPPTPPGKTDRLPFLTTHSCLRAVSFCIVLSSSLPSTTPPIPSPSISDTPVPSNPQPSDDLTGA